MHCARCGASPATAPRFNRKPLCATCTTEFTAQQRENGTRIIAPISLGACVVGAAATIFPMLGVPGLSLLGIFMGAGAGLGLVHLLDRHARTKFCHADRPALPVAHTDPRRLAYQRLRPKPLLPPAPESMPER